MASRASRVFPAATRVRAEPRPAAVSSSRTFRTGGAGGFGGGGFEDILNSMFSGAARAGRPGAGNTFEFDPGGIALDLDLSVAMSVSLEESVNGVEKRVRLPTGKELNVKISRGRRRRPADPVERAGRDRAGSSSR